MSTVIRPEITEKSKYYISKHRYYELKHYCLQYPEWQKEYLTLGAVRGGGIVSLEQSEFSDPTGDAAVKRYALTKKMQLIKDTAELADPELAIYIFEAVTKGVSFTYLKMVMGMPAEKKMYYDRYRKFFWLLNCSH